MHISKKYNVIGIMSGTSMDGIDCSYIKTDGNNFVSIINEKSYKYSNQYRKKLKNIASYFKYKKTNKEFEYEEFVTNKFIQIIIKFIKENNIKKNSIDFIGFSGQTVFHNPENKISIQLGSCKKIQKKLNIKVVGNFRENDMKNGGQGAPIGAFYHKYILKNFSKSSAILNIGGIINITYLDKKKLIAFDVGPGNSLIDDLMIYFYNKNIDKDGKIAFKGEKNDNLINIYKKDCFFKLNYPKSLDREYFKKYFSKLIQLKKENAICTATIMSIESIILGINLLKNKINQLILTGGGRKNLFIVKNLKKILKTKKIKIILIDKINFNGDMLESQAFAYLAVRSYLKLPLSLPFTTGVKKPISGGQIYG